MIVQNLIFPDGSFSDELYVRNAIFENNLISINQDQTASFDTYFNIFSLFKWKKYTKIKNVSIFAELKGEGVICLIGLNKDSVDGEIIKSFDFKCKDFSRILLGYFSIDLGFEFLYLTIKSIKNNVYIKNIVFENDECVLNPIKLACCFCTYKREKEIKLNIDSLFNSIIANSNSLLYDNLHIFIADNGHTLSLNDTKFEKSSYIHLFQNKNFGGSAGFTRCLIEALFNNNNDFSHVVLMDDDAYIRPYVVERTALFLSFLKEEYKGKMIGGALFSKDDTNIQIENGAFYDIKNGSINTFGYNKDMSILKNIIDNDFDSKMNYNAWFYCCIPSSFVNENNLPLPMFIHGDDIEYGMRNKEGFININGICIWHPNPLKTKRLYMSYYDYRARKIIFCENNVCKSLISSLIRDIGSMVVSSLCYNYDDVLYQYLALKDFYSGVESFRNLDAEQKNCEILTYKKFKSEKLSTDSTLKFSNPTDRGRFESLFHLFINLIIPCFKKRYYPCDIMDLWREVNYIGAKRIYLVDESLDSIYFEKNIIESLKSLETILKSILLIILNHRKVYNEWNSEMNKIQNLSFWKEYLAID